MVPAFSLHAITKYRKKSDAKLYVERLLQKFFSIIRSLDSFNEFSELPDYLLYDLQELYDNVAAMASSKTPDTADELRKMKENIAGFDLSDRQFEEKVRDSEESLRKDAINIISERNIDEGILHVLGISENPRAKEILKRFSN